MTDVFEEESERLRTFNNWNNNAVTPEALAKSGFYYLGVEDMVKCAFCGVKMHRWEDGDNPNVEHEKYSPQCPVLNQNGRDECGAYYLHQSNNEMNDLKKRLETFTEWPPGIKQTPLELAQAGFYYLGKSDQVICFSCELGLKHWKEQDNPWEDHAKCSPNCEFLLKERGKEFVQNYMKTNTSVAEQEQEQEQEHNEKNCGICRENNKEVVFIPCGHVLCQICAIKIKEACPFCKCKIDSLFRVYI